MTVKKGEVSMENGGLVLNRFPFNEFIADVYKTLDNMKSIKLISGL